LGTILFTFTLGRVGRFVDFLELANRLHFLKKPLDN